MPQAMAFDWCPLPDLNRHSQRKRILSPPRLPFRQAGRCVQHTKLHRGRAARICVTSILGSVRSRHGGSGLMDIGCTMRFQHAANLAGATDDSGLVDTPYYDGSTNKTRASKGIASDLEFRIPLCEFP